MDDLGKGRPIISETTHLDLALKVLDYCKKVVFNRRLVYIYNHVHFSISFCVQDDYGRCGSQGQI
jgi:hypothetical protein